MMLTSWEEPKATQLVPGTPELPMHERLSRSTHDDLRAAEVMNLGSRREVQRPWIEAPKPEMTGVQKG